MIKVGLVGEDPNDTSSLANLMTKKYPRVQFCPLVKRIKGYQLDNPKAQRSLSVEFRESKCKFVICLRDLDGFKSETNKIKAKIKWFKDINSSINEKGLLLLNIWEIEALILADIETFNTIYKVSYKFSGDPMLQKEPKEILKLITRKSRKQYKESDCPDIFKKLDIETVTNRCSFFKEFLNEFNTRIKT